MFAPLVCFRSLTLPTTMAHTAVVLVVGCKRLSQQRGSIASCCCRTLAKRLAPAKRLLSIYHSCILFDWGSEKMTYRSRGRSTIEVIFVSRFVCRPRSPFFVVFLFSFRMFSSPFQACCFVIFLVGFITVLCIGNYFRAKRAQERQRQRRLAKLAGNYPNGGDPGNYEAPQPIESGVQA